MSGPAPGPAPAPDAQTAVPSRALQVMTLATALCGITTLGAAHVVPVGAALLTAALVVGATAAGLRLTGAGERAVRRRLAITVLLVATGLALVATHGDLTSSAGLALGLLVCATAMSHSLVLESVRDQRVNLAISVSMLVLAAGLAPGLGIVVPVAATWLCALTAFVLAATDAEGADAGYRAVPVPHGSGASGASRGTDAAGRRVAGPVATTVAVTVLLGLAVALVLPHPSGLTAHSALDRSVPASPTTGSPGGRQADAYLGDGPLDLDTRGSLSNQPVAVVTAAPQSLWRAAVLETYDGHSWSNAGDGAVLLNGADPSAVTVPLDPRSPGQADPAPRSDAVAWLSGSTPVVISPGIATTVGLRSSAQVVQQSGGRVLLEATEGDVTYVVRSSVVPSIDGVLPATTGGADATAPVWRALPATVPARVHDLAASVTAGAANRADAVRAVESYLRTHDTYDLDSPVPSPQADSVDDFLFRSKSGFCEQFASAEVVMLRSLGIPARLVSGFAAGRPDGRGEVTLLASDAHAWVEVWIPGVGWVSSDPTAGSALAGPHRDAVAAFLHRVATALTGSPARKVGLAVALLVLAATAVLLPRRIGRRRERGPADRAARAAPAPLFAAFGRLEDALAAAGRPRARAESVRALAARLDATDDVVGALLAVERASYAGTPPSREEARAAADTIDRETARILTGASADPVAFPGVTRVMRTGP